MMVQDDRDISKQHLVLEVWHYQRRESTIDTNEDEVCNIIHNTVVVRLVFCSYWDLLKLVLNQYLMVYVVYIMIHMLLTLW